MADLIYKISLSNNKNCLKNQTVSNDNCEDRTNYFDIVNENNKNVKRTISTPINIPSTPSDITNNMQSSRRRSQPVTDILTGHDQVFGNLNIDVEKLQNVLNRKTSQLDQNNTDVSDSKKKVSVPIFHSTATETSHKTSNVFTKDDFECKNTTDEQPIRTRQRSSSLQTSDAQVIKDRFSDRSGNISSNDSNLLQDVLRKRSEPDIKSSPSLQRKTSRKGSGNSSPLIHKRLSQYQTALENWNSRTGKPPTAIEKKIRAKEALRKESSESNASGGRSSIDETINADIANLNRKTSSISSKKKGIVNKFEEMSNGVTVIKKRSNRRQTKPIDDSSKRASISIVSDYTPEISDNEMSALQRRYSHGLIDNSDANEQNNDSSETDSRKQSTTSESSRSDRRVSFNEQLSSASSLSSINDLNSELNSKPTLNTITDLEKKLISDGIKSTDQSSQSASEIKELPISNRLIQQRLRKVTASRQKSDITANREKLENGDRRYSLDLGKDYTINNWNKSSPSLKVRRKSEYVMGSKKENNGILVNEAYNKRRSRFSVGEPINLKINPTEAKPKMRRKSAYVMCNSNNINENVYEKPKRRYSVGCPPPDFCIEEIVPSSNAKSTFFMNKQKFEEPDNTSEKDDYDSFYDKTLSRRSFSFTHAVEQDSTVIAAIRRFSVDQTMTNEDISTGNKRLSNEHSISKDLDTEQSTRETPVENTLTHGNKTKTTRRRFSVDNTKNQEIKPLQLKQRRFSVDHSTIQNSDKKKTVSRRFSVEHPIDLSLIYSSPDQSDTLFIPRRSTTPVVNDVKNEVEDAVTADDFNETDSSDTSETNAPDRDEHIEVDQIISTEEKKLQLEEKPPKKDSGNYEDESILPNQYDNRETNVNPFKAEMDHKHNLANVLSGVVRRRRSSVVPPLFSIRALESSSCNSHSESDSSYSYDDIRKVSVIENQQRFNNPLSIAAVNQLPPMRKLSHVMSAFNPSKKIDEESGFFDSIEGKRKSEDNVELIDKILDQNIHMPLPDRNRSKSLTIDEPRWMQQARRDSQEERERADTGNSLDSSSTISNYNTHSNNENDNPVMNLRDLKSGSILNLADRSGSFNSMGSSPPEGKRKVSFDQESINQSSTASMRRRKFGTASIISLDELPKRKSSRAVDWFLAEEEENQSMYESCYIPEMVSRKMSMYGQFLTFDDLEQSEGVVVVASKETRDIISESHGTLSTCSDLSPYRPIKGDLNSKLRIDEETDHDDYDNDNLESFSASESSSSPSGSSADEQFSVSDDNGEEFTSDSDNSTVHDFVLVGRDGEQTETEESLNEDETGLVTDDQNDGNDITRKPIDNLRIDKKAFPDERKTTTFSSMFGYFNYCLYEFIKKEYSVEKWKEICGILHLSRRQIAMYEKPKNKTFDDNITDQIIKTASSNLHVNFNLFLQKLGQSYFDWCCTRYGDLLKSIATNLADFINNMDDIRRLIHKVAKINDDYPPSIYCMPDKAGTLLMYYHSNRDQLYLDYFIIGFIKAVAWLLYGMRTRVALQQPRKTSPDFSIISIKAVSSLVKKPSISRLQISTRCKDFILEPYLMDTIFPFHMILNERLEICQLGLSLNRLLEKHIPKKGLNLHTYFRIEKPVIDNLDYFEIRNNLNTAFILSSHQGLFTDTFTNGLILKGQMTYLESSKSLWFIASPKVEFVHQLNGLSNLYLSDIPLHDATRELLLVSEQTHVQDALKSQLQVLTNRLKETSKELALGKINTENILDEIFPKDVAERLMRDLPVPAVTAEEVSILFTDIVGFTAICGKCDPEDVTDMLNNLYLEFDFLCEKFDLYKVETIGDAYMAVGGLHRKHDDHGRFTTAMGIEMIARARDVQTPAGDDIEIRVGIHSGSVVAGVVGTRMPRYCLFGNNVTLANKMEATSEACKVHISPATYLEIKHHQEFIFWERPRDIMPPLMQKLYTKGHTYFVSQRRPSTYYLPSEESEKRYKYMKPIPRKPSEDAQYNIPNAFAPSRKTSHSESVMSDMEKYPPKLRKQLHALEKIQGYEHGKMNTLDMLNYADDEDN